MAERKKRRNWTFSEVERALELYISFRKVPDKKNPEVRKLAAAIRRTPDAVIYKIGNLQHLQTKGKKGFAHVGETDRVVWKEFVAKGLSRPAA